MVGGLVSGLMLGQQLVEMSKSQRGGGRGKNFGRLRADAGKSFGKRFG